MNNITELIGAWQYLAQNLKAVGKESDEMQSGLTLGQHLLSLKWQREWMKVSKKFLVPPLPQIRTKVSVFQLSMIKLPEQICMFESLVIDSQAICVLAFETADTLHDDEPAIGFCTYRVNDQALEREMFTDAHEILVFNPKRQDPTAFKIDGEDMVLNLTSVSIPHAELSMEKGYEGPDPQEMEKHVHAMALQATTTIIQYLVTLNSPGVNVVQVVEPSPLKNKMRVSKGQIPLFPYYALDIDINPGTYKVHKEFTKADYRAMFERTLS